MDDATPRCAPGACRYRFDGRGGACHWCGNPPTADEHFTRCLAPLIEEGDSTHSWRRCGACGGRFDVQPLRHPYFDFGPTPRRSWPMVLAWSVPLITWVTVSAIYGVGWGAIALFVTWLAAATGGANR